MRCKTRVPMKERLKKMPSVDDFKPTFVEVKDSPIQAICINLALAPYSLEWFKDPYVNVMWRYMYFERTVVPYITHLFDAYPERAMDYVCTMIKTTYEYKWQKLQKTIDIVYSPIENNKVTITRNRTADGTARGSSDTGVQTFVSPFNSGENLIVDGANKTGNSSKTETTNTEDESVSHRGFTGVSTQSLLRDERDFANFKLYHILLQDIAELLTISIY